MPPASRTRIAALAALLTLAAAGSVPGGAGAKTTARPLQQTAGLLRAHKVASAPRAGAKKAATIPASAPLAGGRTVLPVVRRKSHWLRVLLPGRPNGHKGWIAQRGTVLKQTPWHLVVRTARRQVLVYRNGRLVRSLTAIVGKPSSPTPLGSFFVEESIRMYPSSPGWPFALALSARSNVLQEFEGGPGQIGIHGVGNIGGMLGTADSHGCVRLGDPNISWLAARIAPGVPVMIRH